MPPHTRTLIITLCAWVGSATFSVALAYPIAGVKPNERPEGAPRITEVQHDRSWYKKALHGVSEPWPPSLLFLERQGNWYTPFDRPGMPGRYDVRGWYGDK